MESTRLIAFDGRDFRRLLSEEPQLENRVLHLLCERIRWATNRYEDAAFLNSQARLAKYVLALAKDQGLQSDVGVEIQVSQSELACYLGMSRKSINQQLHRWKEQGWIEVGRARLLVRKPSALKRLMAAWNDEAEFVD